MKIKILIFLQLFHFSLFAQNNNFYQHLKQEWTKEFSDAKDIIKTYRENMKETGKRNTPSAIQNKCFMLIQSGRYIIQELTDSGRLLVCRLAGRPHTHQ